MKDSDSVELHKIQNSGETEGQEEVGRTGREDLNQVP